MCCVRDANCQNVIMSRMQLSQVLLVAWLCLQPSVVVVSNACLCRQRQVVQWTCRFEAESTLLGAVLDETTISNLFMDFRLQFN